MVLWGVPLDETTSFRKGTCLGPERIRMVSYGIETYSPNFDRDLTEVKFFDAGNILLPRGNLKKSLNNIEKFAYGFLKQGYKLITLGGEHLLSLPLIKSAFLNFPNLKVIHLDAHADLRERYFGNGLSHASVMKRVCDFLSPSNLYQFGIRSGSKDEFEFAKKNTQIFPFSLEGIENLKTKLSSEPIYLSIDIDVIDPAFAPGTGTPEPNGVTPRELFDFLYKLQGLNIIAVDIVEISPPNDFSDITSLLGAKLVREILFLL
ncbi:MAG: agmatinase [Synergistetes bacterium]|nr:agmatinase [Synergistota bacterium]MCX8127433.1 agmatinase [Synergistota bacterium]MDW8192297.1 agmatinase [Synergistota bacterium]